MDAFRTLILPAAVTPLAREIAATLSPGGIGMWATGLSPTGEAPPTHYISSGLIAPEFAHMLPEQVWEQDEDGAWVQTGSTPGNPEAVHAVCTAAGITLPPGTIAALFDAIDVTELGPWAVMARMGVTVVQESL